VVFESFFWHYISLILLNDHLLDSSGIRGDSQFGIDILELLLRLGGLPNVQGFSIPLFEGCCDPALTPEFFPQALPTFIDSVFLEFPSNHLHGLVCQDRDKEVPVATVFPFAERN
jgi:hypothetical protein